MGTEMLEMPRVNLEKCTGCGICEAACHCGAIIIVEGKATLIETLKCGWWCVCEAVCPQGALYCEFEIVIEG